jgi:hypothetical protein
MYLHRNCINKINKAIKKVKTKGPRYERNTSRWIFFKASALNTVQNYKKGER